MPENYKPTPMNPANSNVNHSPGSAKVYHSPLPPTNSMQKAAPTQTVADLILQITQQNNQLLKEIAATQEQVYELQHKIETRDKYKIFWSIGKTLLYIVVGIVAVNYVSGMMSNMMSTLTGGLGGQTSELAQIMKEVNNASSTSGGADTEAIIRELSNFLK